MKWKAQSEESGYCRSVSMTVRFSISLLEVKAARTRISGTQEPGLSTMPRVHVVNPGKSAVNSKISVQHSYEWSRPRSSNCGWPLRPVELTRCAQKLTGSTYPMTR